MHKRIASSSFSAMISQGTPKGHKQTRAMRVPVSFDHPWQDLLQGLKWISSGTLCSDWSAEADKAPHKMSVDQGTRKSRRMASAQDGTVPTDTAATRKVGPLVERKAAVEDAALTQIPP